MIKKTKNRGVSGFVFALSLRKLKKGAVRHENVKLTSRTRLIVTIFYFPVNVFAHANPYIAKQNAVTMSMNNTFTKISFL